MVESGSEAPEYDSAIEDLENLGSTLVGLFGELLRGASIPVHSISFRVKTEDSATRKLSRGGGNKYAGYGDLTDLLGIRIITYFSNEVDLVAGALTPHLVVDEENSVDKRAALEADRFGYMSLHFVAKLSSARTVLVEYRRFSLRRFEIQIRSILQHAWAEIEHDLGYKTGGALPREFRRRFSRLAGLLEVADDEFERLRGDLERHQAGVNEAIDSGSTQLELDQSTLFAFIKTDEVRYLDEAVTRFFSSAGLSAEPDTSFTARLAEYLLVLGVADLDVLLQTVRTRRAHAVKFAEFWSTIPDPVPDDVAFPRGIGLFYIVYTLLATASPEVVDQWMEFYGKGYLNWEGLIPAVEKTWSAVVEELGPLEVLR